MMLLPYRCHMIFYSEDRLVLLEVLRLYVGLPDSGVVDASYQVVARMLYYSQ